MGITVKLNNVRLAFEDLYVASAFKEGQQAKFGGTFIIEADNPGLVTLKNAIQSQGKEVWGDEAEDTWESVKGQTNKCCFGSGKLKKKNEGFEADNFWITAKNVSRPTVISKNKEPKLQGEAGAPYSGCYVNAIVEIYAQKGEYAGMRASLQGVQFASDGDAFAGGSVADTDDFDDLSDGSDAPEMEAGGGGFV